MCMCVCVCVCVCERERERERERGFAEIILAEMQNDSVPSSGTSEGGCVLAGGKDGAMVDVCLMTSCLLGP